MRTDSRSLATLGIAALAIASVTAALALSGGPLQGRKEHRDADREADLGRLSQQIRCLAASDHDRLPESIITTAACPEVVRLNDPFTGVPYRYEVIDARNYRLCADFDLPLDFSRSSWGGAERDVAAGCLVWHLSAAEAPQQG